VGDVKTMSEKAVALLQDEEKLKTFKKNALKQAKVFDIANIIPQYEALYRLYCRTGDC
jgi:glycosyltransferase involved in cell wall biosynthesis